MHPRHARYVLSRLRCERHSLLLGSYLSRIGRIENPSCSACGHSSQDISRLILHCPATDSLRGSLFGDSLSLYDLWSLKNHNFRKTEKLKRSTSIPYVQSVSESISRILTQVGNGVALKPHHTLSSLFRKPKDAINFEQKRGLVYQISCRDCNAVYVGETERSVRTRKREHADAVKTFNTKKSALSQHVMDFDHRIDWDNVKILKSESHAYRHRFAES